MGNWGGLGCAKVCVCVMWEAGYGYPVGNGTHFSRCPPPIGPFLPVSVLISATDRTERRARPKAALAGVPRRVGGGGEGSALRETLCQSQAFFFLSHFFPFFLHLFLCFFFLFSFLSRFSQRFRQFLNFNDNYCQSTAVRLTEPTSAYLPPLLRHKCVA